MFIATIVIKLVNEFVENMCNQNNNGNKSKS